MSWNFSKREHWLQFHFIQIRLHLNTCQPEILHAIWSYEGSTIQNIAFHHEWECVHQMDAPYLYAMNSCSDSWQWGTTKQLRDCLSTEHNPVWWYQCITLSLLITYSKFLPRYEAFFYLMCEDGFTCCSIEKLRGLLPWKQKLLLKSCVDKICQL